MRLSMMLPSMMGGSGKKKKNVIPVTDGLHLYYDFTKLDVPSGTPLPTLYDFSGNDHHAYQETESKQAIVIDGGLKFDGVDDYYTMSANVNMNEVTVIAAMAQPKNPSVSTDAYIIFINAPRFAFSNRGSAIKLYYTVSDAGDSATKAYEVFGENTPFVVHATGGGGVKSMVALSLDNDSLKSSAISVADNVSINWGDTYFGAAVVPSWGLPLFGTIFALIVYNRILPEDEIRSMRSFCIERWGGIM